MASAADEKTSPSFSVLFPPNIIPIPSNIEKKMIGRTSPSASEPIGLRGTIPNKRSPILWED